MKNKAREDGLVSRGKRGPGKASPSKAKVTASTEQTAKTVQGIGAQPKQDTASLVSERKKGSSGVLCSAIANKLRMGQN